MTQRHLFERRLSLKLAELDLLNAEINFLQQAIASMPHEPTQQERENFFKNDIDETKCRKCGGEMKSGQALEDILSGIPDFEMGGDVCTMSASGAARMIPVAKCEKCGWSVTE